jgi:probable FeS assembly SUF system protein SufT
MSESNEWIELSRDCEAVMIPAGHTILLPKGTRAVITQSLGGAYTLHVPEYGGLLRVSNRDGDAVGREVLAEQAAASPADAPAGETLSQEQLEPLVWDQLKTCFDPEIPVNIVDLGLVYDMRVSPADGPRHRVDVKMTLTAPGCGMGTYIAEDAKQKILGLPGVSDAEVEIVWSPQWNPNMISPDGRAKLGME